LILQTKLNNALIAQNRKTMYLFLYVGLTIFFQAQVSCSVIAVICWY